MGFLSDIFGGISRFTENVGNVVTAPVKWGGDILEKTGDITGIRELENIGRTTHDVTVDPTVQKIAGTAATAYAMPNIWDFATWGGPGSLGEAGVEGSSILGSSGVSGADSLGLFPVDTELPMSVSPEAWDALNEAGYFTSAPAGANIFDFGTANPSLAEINSIFGTTANPVTATASALAKVGTTANPATATASALAKGGTGKMANSLWPYLFGAGTLAGGYSNYLGGKRNAEAAKDYLAASTWNPATREKYMTGVTGGISNWLTAKNKSAASNAAALGRGGGFYGNTLNKNLASATEQLAQALATTHQPSNAPLSAYQAANSPSFLESTLGTATSSLLPWIVLSSIF